MIIKFDITMFFFVKFTECQECPKVAKIGGGGSRKFFGKLLKVFKNYRAKN